MHLLPDFSSIRFDIPVEPNTSSALRRIVDQRKRSQFWLIALVIGVTVGFIANSYMEPRSSTANEERERSKDQLLEQGSSFRKNSRVFHRVSQFVQPSVVNISTKTPELNFWGIPRNRENEGTGIILNKKGHILTNHHVVKGENASIQVTLADDRVFQAKRIGYDTLLDLAIVKIDAKNLTPADLGDSSSLRVGQWVLAIGSPFGLNQSVSTGIVSALDRGQGRLPTSDEGYIQTDASINPGNSGGPLVNLKGDVVGINTMILSKSGGSQGVGFAIPINTAKQIIKRIKKEGKVKWGYLGIQTANLNKKDLPVIRRTIKEKYNVLVKSREGLLKVLKLDEPEGVIVLDVDRKIPPTPAQNIGLKPLDIITSFDGEPIKTSNQLRKRILNQKPGKTVPITIIRQGKEVQVDITVGSQ